MSHSNASFPGLFSILLMGSVIALGAFAGISKMQQRDAIRSERNGLIERIAPEAAASWNELRVLERAAKEKRDSLAKRIGALGRNPSEDVVFVQLEADFESIRQARIHLEEKLDEIYLIYERELHAPDPEASVRAAELKREGIIATEKAQKILDPH